jgi:hypothetical protein
MGMWSREVRRLFVEQENAGSNPVMPARRSPDRPGRGLPFRQHSSRLEALQPTTFDVLLSGILFGLWLNWQSIRLLSGGL